MIEAHPEPPPVIEEVLKPTTDSVLMPRPAARAVLMILVTLIFLNSIGAFVLAATASGSVFWKMIDKDDFNFPFIWLIVGSLIGVGLLGIALTLSTLALLQDP